MAATTGPRNTIRKGDDVYLKTRTYPVAAATKINQGAMVMLDTAGRAIPAAATALRRVVGVAEKTADNTSGAAGAILVTVRVGVFKFVNSSAGDLIAQADVDQACFVVDDQTVAKTSNTNARPRAGIIVDVDSDGVWVLVTPHPGRVGTAIALAAGANPTKAEFDALVKALQDAGHII